MNESEIKNKLEDEISKRKIECRLMFLDILTTQEDADTKMDAETFLKYYIVNK